MDPTRTWEFKLNTSVLVFSSDKTGSGMVLHDCHGLVMMAGAKNLPARYVAAVAEAMPIFFGIQ